MSQSTSYRLHYAVGKIELMGDGYWYDTGNCVQTMEIILSNLLPSDCRQLWKYNVWLLLASAAPLYTYVVAEVAGVFIIALLESAFMVGHPSIH